jgi:hypothetical protein
MHSFSVLKQVVLGFIGLRAEQIAVSMRQLLRHSCVAGIYKPKAAFQILPEMRMRSGAKKKYSKSSSGREHRIIP